MDKNMKNSWKTLSSTQLYQNDLVNIKINKVIPPDGIVKEYPIIERRSTVVIVPVDKDNQVIMIKQYRYIIDKTLLEVPAGYMEKGEKPLETAKRELAEEVC